MDHGHFSSSITISRPNELTEATCPFISLLLLFFNFTERKSLQILHDTDFTRKKHYGTQRAPVSSAHHLNNFWTWFFLIEWQGNEIEIPRPRIFLLFKLFPSVRTQTSPLHTCLLGSGISEKQPKMLENRAMMDLEICDCEIPKRPLQNLCSLRFLLSRGKAEDACTNLMILSFF